MASLYVSSNELKEVANSLKEKKEELVRIYSIKVRTILMESKEVIIVSGLNFDEINEQFRVAFSNLEARLDDLSNALTNQIIPQYEGLNSLIRRAFNVDFANQMNEILKNLK